MLIHQCHNKTELTAENVSTFQISCVNYSYECSVKNGYITVENGEDVHKA